MSIKRSLLGELERFGETITVTTEQGQKTIKGILQPLLYKNKMYISGKQLPSGYFDMGHYLVICPPEIKLPVVGNAFFECGGKRYILKRSEVVKEKGRELYLWAVLCPYAEPSEEEFL